MLSINKLLNKLPSITNSKASNVTLNKTKEENIEKVAKKLLFESDYLSHLLPSNDGNINTNAAKLIKNISKVMDSKNSNNLERHYRINLCLIILLGNKAPKNEEQINLLTNFLGKLLYLSITDHGILSFINRIRNVFTKPVNTGDDFKSENEEEKDLVGCELEEHITSHLASASKIIQHILAYNQNGRKPLVVSEMSFENIPLYKLSKKQILVKKWDIQYLRYLIEKFLNKNKDAMETISDKIIPTINDHIFYYTKRDNHKSNIFFANDLNNVFKGEISQLIKLLEIFKSCKLHSLRLAIEYKLIRKLKTLEELDYDDLAKANELFANAAIEIMLYYPNYFVYLYHNANIEDEFIQKYDEEDIRLSIVNVLSRIQADKSDRLSKIITEIIKSNIIEKKENLGGNLSRCLNIAKCVREVLEEKNFITSMKPIRGFYSVYANNDDGLEDDKEDRSANFEIIHEEYELSTE